MIDKYKKPGQPRICPLLEEGQEFISTNLNMPEHFCSWAWADIEKYALVLALGGNFDSMARDGVVLACCTDAFRPVVFELERI